MRDKKKVYTWSVSVLTVMLLLSACSGNNSSGTPGNEASASAGPKTQPKVSILTTSSAPYTQSVSNWDESPYVKKVEELSDHDLHFEFLGWSDYQTQLTVRFASGQLADMIRTPSIDFAAHASAVEQGALHDLTDLIDKHGPNLKAKIPEAVWKDPKVSKNGKIYAIPALVPNPNTTAMFIRQDWLDKAGMKTPVTLDDWLAYFEKVKTMDMNDNGDPNDEYGFYVRENLASSDMFFYQFGVYKDYWVMKDGEFIPSVITPNMKEVLKFWRNLYQKGYVNPNAFTNKATTWQAGIQNSQAGSWLHFVDNLADSWLPSKFVGQKDPKSQIVEPPVGPNNQQGIAPAALGIYHVWIVPTSVKDPERIIKFLNWAWGDEKLQQYYAFGLEGHNHTVKDGKVVWDPSSPNNLEKNEAYAYQVNTNVTGHSINGALEIAQSPYAKELQRGFEISNKYAFKNEAMYMPVMEAFKTRPELLPNFSSGATLLLDMFAKVVTGNGDIDAEFDKFVAEWKSRGGNDAIKQATEWHKQFYGK